MKLETSNSPEQFLVEKFRSGFAAPFRGEIWEDDADVPMIDAYGRFSGRPFDIETCCYWKEPLRAANRPGTRRLGITAANQIAKTLICELIARHKIKHDPGHMCFYDDSIESSDDHAKTRAMPMFKSIPAIGSIIAGVENENRFAVTTTDILLPGMILRFRPLNETATQKITLRYIFIHDAALAEKNGQIRRAFIRATQFEGQELIVVESQGGVEGDDFTEFIKTTDDAHLWVRCPLCGKAQEFAWHAQRGEDFRAAPPLSVESLNRESWIEHHTALLRKTENSHAGFKRGDEQLIRTAEGDYDERAILAGTYYECFHCGGAWRDDGENGPTRRAIDASSHYVPTRTNVLPGHHGFRIPCWINTTIPWGKIMLEYLLAKKAQREFGNLLPLQEWHTKRAGDTWNPNIAQEIVPIAVGSYDTELVVENEHSRDMAVDCQKHETQDTVGTFWYVVRVFDKFGNSWQLARGFARSWEEWLAVKKRWKIPNARVVIDAAKWTTQVMLRAAAEYEVVSGKFMGKESQYYSTWRLFWGDDARQFKHPDGQSRAWSFPIPAPITVFDKEGRRMTIRLQKYRWSNIAFELQLDAILAGTPGMPKFNVLSRDKLPRETQEKERGDLTYEKQMKSVYLTEKRGKQIFEKLRPGNHYRDCELMLMVRASQDGLLGHTIGGEALTANGL